MSSPFDRLRADGLVEPVGLRADRVRLTWQSRWPIPEHDRVVVEIAVPGAAATRRLEVERGSAALLVDPPDAAVWVWRVGREALSGAEWSPWQRVVAAAPDGILDGAWIVHPDAASDSPDSRSTWFSVPLRVHAGDEAVFAHIAATGTLDVRLDGRPVGRRVLGAGFGDPRREVAAFTCDLGRPAPGDHLLTVELAPGPYWIDADGTRYSKLALHARGPMLAAMIEIVGAAPRRIVSGRDAFRAGRGATTSSSWYGGEDFDAGLAEPWQDAGAPAEPLGALEDVAIWWPQHPPIECVDVLDPVAVRTAPDRLLVDFGVNIAGVPRLSWDRADRERTVRILPGEHLRGDRVSQESTGSPIYDRLRIPADHDGSWHPRFGYHGFRHLEVAGWIGAPPRVQALVTRVADRPAGGFSSSDRFLGTLHRVVDRAVQSNMFGVFTDCPHREKLGWLEQLHLCFDALARNYDVEAHLRDVLHHVREAQLPSGAIPNIAPELVDFTGHGFLGDDDAFRFDVNWGGVIVELPAKHYRHFGDPRVLEENTPAMRRYLDHLATLEDDGLLDFGLGDWVALDPSTRRRLVASHGYLRVLRSALDIARTLGDVCWARDLEERVDRVDRSIRRFDGTGGTQTELALLADLARARGDEPAAERATELLLERIEADGRRFTVGEVGMEPLIDALHLAGRDDKIWEIIRRDEVPGYGMQLAKGVTALAETWSTESGPDGEGSNNHFMLGMIDHWLHRHVAGLRQAPASVGWRRAIVEPVFLDGVGDAESVLESSAGRYAVRWVRRAPGRIGIHVDVPSGGEVLLRLPDRDEMRIGCGSHDLEVAERDTLSAMGGAR